MCLVNGLLLPLSFQSVQKGQIKMVKSVDISYDWWGINQISTSIERLIYGRRQQSTLVIAWGTLEFAWGYVHVFIVWPPTLDNCTFPLYSCWFLIVIYGNWSLERTVYNNSPAVHEHCRVKVKQTKHKISRILFIKFYKPWFLVVEDLWTLTVNNWRVGLLLRWTIKIWHLLQCTF